MEEKKTFQNDNAKSDQIPGLWICDGYHSSIHVRKS